MAQPRRNLISLRALDVAGLVKLDKGTLKVSKGSMMVLKGVRYNGICLLQGMEIGGSGDAMVTRSYILTYLWHRRLRHIGEKGLF